MGSYFGFLPGVCCLFLVSVPVGSQVGRFLFPVSWLGLSLCVVHGGKAWCLWLVLNSNSKPNADAKHGSGGRGRVGRGRQAQGRRVLAAL